MKKILLLFTICAAIFSCEIEEENHHRYIDGSITISTISEQYKFLNQLTLSTEQYDSSKEINGLHAYNNSNCVIINREFKIADDKALHIHLTIRPDIGDSTLKIGKRYSSKEFTVFDYNTHKERVNSVSSSIKISWRDVSGWYHAHTSEGDEAWVEFTDFSPEKLSGRFFIDIKSKDMVELMIDGQLNNYHLLYYDCTTTEKY